MCTHRHSTYSLPSCVSSASADQTCQGDTLLRITHSRAHLGFASLPRRVSPRETKVAVKLHRKSSGGAVEPIKQTRIHCCVSLCTKDLAQRGHQRVRIALLAVAWCSAFTDPLATEDRVRIRKPLWRSVSRSPGGRRGISIGANATGTQSICGGARFSAPGNCYFNETLERRNEP